ncbi:Transcription factor [Penicillium alfredii]|uniref:Transcription factor n=1 Tax=Penicillium alfredii TaxID=1506179 RepID=A0A9W9KFF3_9EURO|nr:Transcription factor [Penicillium alfredii]KAJ5104475.1 Transcription factor [Penicillium alfredii]
MSDSTPRKRSRLACTSCQARKRKCSGEQPCSTCAQSGVDCQYNAARKKRARSDGLYWASLPALDDQPLTTDSSANIVPHTAGTSIAGSTTTPTHHTRFNDSGRAGQSLEANSGAAFVRKLGLRIDPAHAPRLQLFAWNVGERRFSPALSSLPASAPTASAITKIISQEEMRRLVAIYFEKVDPCYAFLDRKTVLAHIATRWPGSSALPAAESTEQSYDAVLCGVAAFGYLFSRREIMATELRLIEAARLLLEKCVLSAEPPSIDMVTGWVLRVAYLRMTASPHAAWMASCTLMHLVEAAGLHRESPHPDAAILLPSSSTETHTSAGSNAHADNDTASTTSDPDTRRRIFGMARHLNTWISFDLGRSRVVLHDATAQPPTARVRGPPLSAPHGPRADLFHLLPLSESLDPTGPTPQDLPELETALSAALDLAYSELSLILVQCNLMLCIYRRLRALNAHAPLSTHLLDRVLTLAGRGLRAARGMVASTCPWHQVANVPFQVVCTLLAIDNRAALALLPDAMRTLREVHAAYDTPVMREAYSTAYLLVALHQRRKEDDTRALAEILRANSGAAAAPDHDPSRSPSAFRRETSLQQQQQHHHHRSLEESEAPVSDAELSWLGDLMIDMPSLQNFDLDQFLMTDVPWPLPEMGI